ncbi:MAG TPA: TlpA disulfide reductase family protein [Bryobacteraceae bacterium]|nr:TlpA disulfide reductase family protein [Bryobacteraceae bacterium]
MSDRSYSPFLLLCVAVLAIVYVRGTQIGRKAPDFDLRGAYGGDYHLDSFHGHPVLLAFWSTSCSICRHELPILDGMRAEANQNGVEIACVNIGDLDGARDVMRPLHLLSLVDPDGSAARAYGVSGVPRLVLVGADGKIKRFRVGYTPENTIRAWLH